MLYPVVPAVLLVAIGGLWMRGEVHRQASEDLRHEMAVVLHLKDVLGGVQATYKLSIEVEGEAKPACVAEMVMRLYFDDDPVAAMKRARERRKSS